MDGLNNLDEQKKKTLKNVPDVHLLKLKHKTTFVIEGALDVAVENKDYLQVTLGSAL